MAWSASIVARTFDGDRLGALVRYTDGSRNIEVHYKTASAPPAGWLVDQVRDKIDALTALDLIPITTGPILPSGPPSPPDPDRVAWLIALDRLRRASEFVRLGVIQPDNAQLTALQDTVRAGLAEFGDL